MASRKIWSPADDKWLLRLSSDPALTIGAISDRMGVPRKQLLARMALLGISGRDVVWTDEMTAFLALEVPARGYAYCAKRLQVSIESVRVKSLELGLPVPRLRTEPWSPDEDALLLRRRNAGASFSSIAHELLRTAAMVRYRFTVLQAGRASRPSATSSICDSKLTLSLDVAANPNENSRRRVSRVQAQSRSQQF